MSLKLCLLHLIEKNDDFSLTVWEEAVILGALGVCNIERTFFLHKMEKYQLQVQNLRLSCQSKKPCCIISASTLSCGTMGCIFMVHSWYKHTALFGTSTSLQRHEHLFSRMQGFMKIVLSVWQYFRHLVRNLSGGQGEMSA